MKQWSDSVSAQSPTPTVVERSRNYRWSNAHIFLFAHKNQLEHGAHEGLNEKQLRKEREGEVIAHKAEPLHERGVNLKAVVVGIVEKSRNQAHRGHHQADRGTDNRGFKQNGVRASRVKVLRGEAEGERASVHAFHRVGKAEFHEHDRPHGQNAAEHVDATDFPHGRKHARRSRNGAERVAVYDIDAVEHIGMDSDDHGDECEDHSLKLISWHKNSL